MALATTCPKCNTSFRVAPEQLASRRGMVRCGICQDVFSGMANLRHVDEILRPARPAAGEPSSSRAASSAPSNASLSRSTAVGDASQLNRPSALGSGKAGTAAARSKRSKDFEQTDLRTAFFLPETVFGPSTQMVAQGQEFTAAPTGVPASLRSVPPAEKSATEAPPSDAITTPSAAQAPSEDTKPFGLKRPTAMTRFRWAQENSDTVTLPTDGTVTAPTNGTGTADPAIPSADAVLPSGASISDSAEQREADSKDGDLPSTATPSRKRSSRQRRTTRDRSDEAIAYFATEESSGGFSSRAVAFGWLGCAVALLLLVVQLIVVSRNSVASQFPSLRGALASLVSPLGLKVEPARDLQALTIEAFELQAASTPGLFSVTALLRNRSAHGVFWPALEMTLTDGQGTLLVRKVLLPSDYLPGLPADLSKDADRGVSPRAELPLRLALEARDLVPTNYSVTLFYP